MRTTTWLRIASLGAALALPALSGCNTDVSRPGGTDNGPGKGTLGTPDSGGDNSPRRGSAATSPERTGPN